MTPASVLLNIPEICIAFIDKANEELGKKQRRRKRETY